MNNEKEILPLARRDALVIKELQNEVLVYDLERDKAHCLNPTAAAVWKRCDGKLAVTDMTRLLEKELQSPVKDEVVWLALQQLDKFHLLQERATVPSAKPGLSRRELMRSIGVTALLLPAIISITVPPAAQAQSCLPDEGQCSSNAECCSKCCPDGTCLPVQNCTG